MRIRVNRWAAVLAITALTVCGFGLSAAQGGLIPINTVTTTSTLVYPPIRLIQDAQGDYNYAAPNPSSGGGGTAWYTTDPGSSNVQLVFDLTAVERVDELIVWSYYTHSPPSWNLELFSELDGAGTILLSNDFSIIPGVGGTSIRNVIDVLDTAGVQSAVLTSLINSASGGTGLSEVAFANIPEPSTFLLAAFGLPSLALFARGRRRRGGGAACYNGGTVSLDHFSQNRHRSVAMRIRGNRWAAVLAIAALTVYGFGPSAAQGGLVSIDTATTTSTPSTNTPAVLIKDALGDYNYAAPNPGSGGGGTSWHTGDAGSSSVSVVFDLTEAERVDELLVWDYYGHSPTSWNLQLFSGADATGTTLLLHDFSISPASGGSTRHVIDVLDTPGVRSAMLTSLIDSTRGGTGLSEVAFANIPEPSTFLLAAFGLPGLALFARGRRRRGPGHIDHATVTADDG